MRGTYQLSTYYHVYNTSTAPTQPDSDDPIISAPKVIPLASKRNEESVGEDCQTESWTQLPIPIQRASSTAESPSQIERTLEGRVEED